YLARGYAGTRSKGCDPKRDSDGLPHSAYAQSYRKTCKASGLTADAHHSSDSGVAQDLRPLGIGLLSSNREVARAAEKMLTKRYRIAAPDEAQTLVALGGDGFMLHTLHRMLEGECPHLPVFGINRGTVGFLMNEWRLEDLAARIAAAKAIRVAPLEMRATTVSGETF